MVHKTVSKSVFIDMHAKTCGYNGIHFMAHKNDNMKTCTA